MIAFNFPLLRTFSTSDFTLYQLQSFPVPVPGDNNFPHVSKITDLPYGIAFASYRSYFEYLLFDTKPQLHGHSFYLTRQNSQSLRILSKHHTCTSALTEQPDSYPSTMSFSSTPWTFDPKHSTINSFVNTRYQYIFSHFHLQAK